MTTGDDTFDAYQDRKVLYVRLSRIIDPSGFLGQCFDDLKNERTQVFIHCQDVDQLSSAAWGKLLVLKKHAELFQGKVILCGVSAELLQSMQLIGFDKCFPIKGDDDFGGSTAKHQPTKPKNSGTISLQRPSEAE